MEKTDIQCKRKRLARKRADSWGKTLTFTIVPADEETQCTPLMTAKKMKMTTPSPNTVFNIFYYRLISVHFNTLMRNCVTIVTHLSHSSATLVPPLCHNSATLVSQLCHNSVS